jgi:hypothetical protein
MPQPTAEQWWNALDEADRQAFSAAAERPHPLPRDLADKLRAAGVHVIETGFEGPMEPVFPRLYVNYARAQSAAEHPEAS